MRDGLIELISQVQYMGGLEGKLADHLLAEGVIVPPCKVGDTVWSIVAAFVVSFEVEKIEITSQGGFFGTSGCFYWRSFEDFGKTVFLTKEEAENALKERKENEIK